MPALLGAHVDREIDLAAGRRGTFGDELRDDVLRVGERRHNMSASRRSRRRSITRYRPSRAAVGGRGPAAAPGVARIFPDGSWTGSPGILVEVGPQPALRLLDGDAAPAGIILELVAADARDSEILAVAMREVEA